MVWTPFLVYSPLGLLSHKYYKGTPIRQVWKVLALVSETLSGQKTQYCNKWKTPMDNDGMDTVFGIQSFGTIISQVVEGNPHPTSLEGFSLSEWNFVRTENAIL
jgi:hypothetical protein